MADKVKTPAEFVPLHAVAYGAEGAEAVAVSMATPLPVSSSPAAATRAGLAFLSSTPILDVATTENLYFKISNTSGRNLFLYNRIFSNDLDRNDPNMSYAAYINPTATLSQTAPSANAIIGGAVSAASVTYQVAQSIAMGGIQATGEQLPNGVPYSRPVLVVLNSGTSLGFSLNPPGSPAASARVSIVVEWWEEPL